MQYGAPVLQTGDSTLLHVCTLWIYACIGLFFSPIAGKLGDTEALYRSSLEIQMHELGFDHDNTHMTSEYLDDLLREQGRQP